jgi:hypothetical protein
MCDGDGDKNRDALQKMPNALEFPEGIVPLFEYLYWLWQWISRFPMNIHPNANLSSGLRQLGH